MSVEQLFAWLDDLSKSRAKTIEVTECLQEIGELTTKTGLDKLLLDSLWRKVLSLPRPSLCTQGIYLAIPNDGVLPDTIDFLLAWVIDAIKTDSNNAAAVKGVLQWLTCAVYCKIISAKDLQHGYYSLLLCLQTPGFACEICHLLYYLTKPYLITPFTVKYLLSVRFPKKNYCHAALVSLYKRLKPHLIDQSFIAYANDLELLPVLPRKILDCFNIARGKRKSWTNKKRCRYPNWQLQTIAYKKRKLGNITYISEMTLPDAILESRNSKVFIGGSVFDSFLMNPYGFIFLAMADTELHDWMLIYIEKELEAKQTLVFRRETEEFASLLTNLTKLQKVYGQAIAPIDRFMKKNFSKWNGILYSKQMFGLLSDITISDYKEVFDSILTPLYHLNMKFKDKQFSKQTIRSLAKCFLNNINRLNKEEYILHSSESFNPCIDALKQFENSFQHLCILFMNMYAENAEILHEIADSYIILSSAVQSWENYDQEVLPSGILNRMLINSDFALINKFCRILVTHIEREGREGALENDLPSEPVRNQLEQFLNILFKNILISSIFETDDFKAIDEQIGKFENVRKDFRSRNNLTFMPLVRVDNEGKFHPTSDMDVYKQMTRDHCEYFAALILPV